MPSCSVIGCGKKKTKDSSLTLHRLPRSDQKKKKWLEAIRKENIKTNVKEVYICSLHFEDNCFNRTLELIRLRDEAVPSKFLRHLQQHASPPRDGRDTVIKDTPLVPLAEHDASDLPRTITAASDAAPVRQTFDVETPKQTQKIKKLKDTCDCLRKTIKRLNEKARRQRIKIVQFQNIIKDLQIT